MEEGVLVIKGIQVKPEILRKDAIRRCADSRCGAVCCSGGVWLNEGEKPRILAWADAIKARIPAERHDLSIWFEKDDEEDEWGTNSVEDPLNPGKTCCVFLQTDRKCALQVISNENHLGWPGIKPFFCATYPLLLDEDRVLSIDDETPLLYEGGFCRKSSPEGLAPYELYRDEAILILGQDGYEELLERAKK